MLSSYITYSQLQSYASDRGITLASNDTAVQTKATVRGSMALDAMYEDRFSGTKAAYPQERSFPRTGATWPDGSVVSGIPDQILWAACELSIAELATPGILTPVVTPGKVKKSGKVEGIRVEYFEGQGQDAVSLMTPVLTLVEGLLSDLVGSRTPLPGILVV